MSWSVERRWSPATPSFDEEREVHTIELCACMFFQELQNWVIFEDVYLCMLPQSALIAFSAVGRVATFNRYIMKQCKWSSVVILRKSSSVEVYQAFLDSFGVFMKKCIMWGSLSIHVDCCLQFDAFRYSDADWSSSIICSRKQAIYRMSVLGVESPKFTVV